MASYQVRIGMMFPFDDPYLKSLIGYETSAGAVTVALDRVRDEKLLPGANFRYLLEFLVFLVTVNKKIFRSFVIRNCECREDVTAGYVVEMLEKNLIDVLISSPCAPRKSNFFYL